MAETLNSYLVPEHHVIQFTNNVRAAVFRKPSLLSQHVMHGSHAGSDKSQVVNFIGPIAFQQRDTPYSDTKLSEMEHKQRWVSGAEFDAATLIDRLDTLKMIYDPTNPYVERFREAAALKVDDTIMAAFFADAKTGVQGLTAAAFDSNNIIVHGATGLTVAKLRAARKKFKKNLVDLRAERPRILVSSEEVDDLLGEVAVGSSDYNAVKPLVDGEVSAFMGFDFIPNEGSIPTHDDAGVVRDCPAWVPSGMYWGDWQTLVIRIDNRPDKNNIPQIHGTFTGGATRLEEHKVLQVQCKE